jgi:two-component system sensor histidine kinase KdpD
MDGKHRVRATASLPHERTDTNALTTGMLFQFAQQTTQLDLHREPGPQLASLLQSVFSMDAAAVFDSDLDKVYARGEWSEDMENLIRNTYIFESATDDPEIGLTRRVLRIGNLPIGAMMLRGEIHPLTSDCLACLIAITFDRFHSLANVSRTESARQAEQLRTTVLDSLAHAYKTPLTAIRAATTGLTEMGRLSAAQAELVQLIDEEATRLNGLTTRLLQTSRMESRDLTLHVEPVDAVATLREVVGEVSERTTGISVEVIAPQGELMLICDRELLLTLLTQYLENAGKYALAGSTVTAKVKATDDAIVFSVHNIGPAILEADWEHIFDRYFRCADSSTQVPGTGIGLSVARHAARAHGGDVWLTSSTEQGTTFFASLPKHPHAGDRT